MAELRAPKGARKRSRPLGRGNGSGKGKTCGRGQKGQGARAGGGPRPGFEGGQMPLYRRVARRGFSNAPFRREVDIVNLRQLEQKFASGDSVTPAALVACGLMRRNSRRVKVLGQGAVTKTLHLSGVAVSAQARTKIEGAGGSVTQGSDNRDGDHGA